MTKENIESALEDCLSSFSARNCPFDEWEQEFLESVDDQYQEKKFLSIKQQNILQKMWDKV